MKTLRKPTVASGFTLLEVMIAMSIFAIMGLASYQLLSGEIRIQERLQQHSDRHNSWQRSMMRLSRDIQQIVDRGIREDYGEREAALISDGQSLQLTRQGWSNPLERPRSELQRVHYSLQSHDNLPVNGASQPTTNASLNAEKCYSLRRQFWPNLDRAPGSEAIQQTLFIGVTDLRLRFFHTGKRQWVTQWPTSDDEAGELPQAIEITLTSDQYGETQRLFTLTPTTDDMLSRAGQR